MDLLAFAVQNARREFRQEHVMSPESLREMIERREEQAKEACRDADPRTVAARPCPICGQWAKRQYIEDSPVQRVFECPDAHRHTVDLREQAEQKRA